MGGGKRTAWTSQGGVKLRCFCLMCPVETIPAFRWLTGRGPWLEHGKSSRARSHRSPRLPQRSLPPVAAGSDTGRRVHARQTGWSAGPGSVPSAPGLLPMCVLQRLRSACSVPVCDTTCTGQAPGCSARVRITKASVSNVGGQRNRSSCRVASWIPASCPIDQPIGAEAALLAASSIAVGRGVFSWLVPHTPSWSACCCWPTLQRSSRPGADRQVRR